MESNFTENIASQSSEDDQVQASRVLSPNSDFRALAGKIVDDIAQDVTAYNAARAGVLFGGRLNDHVESGVRDEVAIPSLLKTVRERLADLSTAVEKPENRTLIAATAVADAGYQSAATEQSASTDQSAAEEQRASLIREKFKADYEALNAWAGNMARLLRDLHRPTLPNYYKNTSKTRQSIVLNLKRIHDNGEKLLATLRDEDGSPGPIPGIPGAESSAVKILLTGLSIAGNLRAIHASVNRLNTLSEEMSDVRTNAGLMAERQAEQEAGIEREVTVEREASAEGEVRTEGEASAEQEARIEREARVEQAARAERAVASSSVGSGKKRSSIKAFFKSNKR